ncbi:MAG: type III pantothenate kinase [Mariniphaga sp.]|nr:type III pantothenate kinase [Mariniphaga sp.]MDD4424952.1 type III pantothenate kinase [Mariniphaga sp.]
MNLIIDIGNTRTKLSLFNRDEEVLTVPVDELLPTHLDMLCQEHPGLNQAIVSAVKNYPQPTRTYLQTHFQTFMELDGSTPLPIENCYHTPETLGKDRIAAAVGASFLYPGNHVLVIDAGTAITYDLINNKNQYLGGNISPGLDMRFQALHHFTGRLPRIKTKNMKKLFGQSTREAILAGVQNGIVFEVDKTIDAFKEFYKNLIVIITGGDANFFDKKLKNSFFVHFNLIAIGLNRILEHNGEI